MPWLEPLSFLLSSIFYFSFYIELLPYLSYELNVFPLTIRSTFFRLTYWLQHFWLPTAVYDITPPTNEHIVLKVKLKKASVDGLHVLPRGFILRQVLSL